MTYEKKGGSCNSPSTRVVILDQPEENCTIVFSRATAVGDGCKLEQRATCNQGSLSADETMVLQIPAALDVITGTATIDVKDTAEPNKTCTGTYDVTYTKK